MFDWIAKLFDRLFVVATALLFFQVPLFMAQYEHQLRGHVAESQWHIKQMTQAAHKSGKNLDQYIHKFASHEDGDVSNQGKHMDLVLTRSRQLTEALVKLEEASIFARPFVFVAYLDTAIFTSTAKSFQPGITFTLEGALYAFAGILMWSLFLRLVILLIRKKKATLSSKKAN